jgi:Fe-S cluster biogenesis protein NfuA
VLHDLHPVDVGTRVEQALEQVRPYLGSHAGGVTYRGIDEDGVAHLELEGNCSGCPSSSITVTHSIERAILEAAPEVVGVAVVEVERPPALVQIQPLHPYADTACPAVS